MQLLKIHECDSRPALLWICSKAEAFDEGLVFEKLVDCLPKASSPEAMDHSDLRKICEDAIVKILRQPVDCVFDSHSDQENLV